MPKPVETSPEALRSMDKDRALQGEYGPAAKQAFEHALTLLEKDTDGDGVLSDEEFDKAIGTSRGAFEVIEGRNGEYIVKNYGSSDGKLSVEETAQAFLHGAIVTRGGSPLVTFGGGPFFRPVVLAAVSQSDSIKGLDDRTTNILAAAYGTNGELSDAELDQIVNDGVLARDGDGFKNLNLGKMPSDRVAKAFLVTDGNHDGLVNADEFDAATDLIFGDNGTVNPDQARTLMAEYGQNGMVNADQIKKMLDDQVLHVEPGRKPLRIGYTNDGSKLYGSLNFDNLPSKITGYMAKDADGNGKLSVSELAAFFDERQARILAAAYGQNGEVDAAQIKQMLDDGVVHRDGENLNGFNLGKLPSDRLAGALFAFDDNHDGLINADEFDRATDALFLDNGLVSSQAAYTLAMAYGTNGLLNLDQVKSIISDGVIKGEPAERHLRIGSMPDGSRLQGTITLSNMPTDKLPGALMAFDKNGDGHLDAGELDHATDVISGGNNKLVNPGDADKIVKLLAADGKGLTADEAKKLVDNKVLSMDGGKLVYNERGISAAVLSNPSTSTPWADDYFKYISETNLPGEDGTINDIAFQRLLEEYKDAPAGSDKRKFYDLTLAKYFLSNGYSNPDEFHKAISGEDFGNNVIDPAKVDEQLNQLMDNSDFAKVLSDDLAKKTNDVIAEHFVLVDGKITLLDKNNPAQKDAVPVDGTAWAKAALAYTRTEEGRKEYATGTPEEQQAFIKKYFGALGSLLPPDEVTAALGELGVNTAVDAIMGKDIKDISDEDLAAALQVVGQYMMSARGPTNLIGNLSNMTQKDWLSLAKALKMTDGPLNVEAILSKLSPGDSPVRQFIKNLGASGMWGTFAGAAGLVGAILTYSADGPARDRLLAGDPREILGLSQTLTLVLSYSPSTTKGITGFLGQLGFKDMAAFNAEFKKLPGFDSLLRLSTQFDSSFGAVADALQGVDIGQIDAVKKALEGVDPATKKLWADIGFDFDALPEKIVAHAQQFDTAGIYGSNVKNTSALTKEERLGFLFDMTGIDKNYKDVVRAAEILESKTPGSITVTDETTLRQRLKAQGMSDEAIDRVVSEMDVLSREGAPAATGIRAQLLKDMPGGKLTVIGPAPDPKNIKSGLMNEAVEKFLGLKLEKATAGLFIKGLGAAMDVIGGVIGVGTGIYDVIKGAGSGDVSKIISGSLGIASGALGALGGLAGFGLLGGVAAGPLFIVAGVFGLIGLLVGIFSGKQPVEEFTHGILDHFSPYGIVRDGAGDYLKGYFNDNWRQFDPAPPQGGGGKP